MICGRTLLTVASTVLLAASSANISEAQGARPQHIHLHVSTQDGSVSGHADLVVVRAARGFHISGTVANDVDSQGCVTLKAVEMHMGLDFGGNTVRKVCGKGQSVLVSAQTGHHQVVLQVDEPDTVDFESRIVTLTG